MTDTPLPRLATLVAMQAAVSAGSLVVEIVAGRMLAPYVGTSLYTWTAVIAVVLAGFSAGHWLGGRLAEARPGRALALTGWALAGAALSTAGAVFLLRAAAGPVLDAMAAPVAAITVLAAAAFFVPSFFAGVPAPVFAAISVAADPARAGRALGAMFASGSIGAIVGTLAAGFLFISWLGSVATLVCVTALYAVLALMCLRAGRRAGHAVGAVAAAAAVALPLGLGAASLTRLDPCTRESDYFCIRVVDISASERSPVRLMVLDHLVHGISARDTPQRMYTEHAAMLQALAAERTGAGPFSAYFIGGGTYSLPRAWAAREPAPEVTVAEIDPAVTEVAAESFWFDPASARVVHADARRVLRREDARYDVIVGDAFTDIAVPQHLITGEFFDLVRARLTDDGVYLMNVIDHTDNMRALASIAETLRAVFPTVEVWTEARPAEAGERRIFILLAGERPTAQSALTGHAPDPFRFGRLSSEWLDRVIAEHRNVRLSDDYAPIDRLMRWRD